MTDGTFFQTNGIFLKFSIAYIPKISANTNTAGKTAETNTEVIPNNCGGNLR